MKDKIKEVSGIVFKHLVEGKSPPNNGDEIWLEFINANDEFFYLTHSETDSFYNNIRYNSEAEPNPFTIPSRKYTNQIWERRTRQGLEHRPKSEVDYFIKEPQYIIKTDVVIGGNYWLNTYNIERKEFKHTVNINRCIFRGKFLGNYLSSNYTIKFHGCKFEDTVKFENTEIGEIIFEDCDFSNSELQLDEISVKKIQIIKCKNLNLSIKNISSKQKNNIKNNISLRCDELIIEESLLSNFEVSGNSYGEVKISSSEVSKISIDIILNRSFSIRNNTTNKINVDILKIKIEKIEKEDYSFFEGLKINEFSLTGSLNGGVLNFINNEMKYFTIEDLTNDGKLRFLDVNIIQGGTVNILKSNLYKTEFTDVDLSKTEKFTISLSNLSECLMYNTIFPLNINTKKTNDNKGVREIYRQLKNSAYKQGDRANELLYESIEMQSLQKIFKEEDNTIDHFILCSNYWSNRHGQNWKRALFILLFMPIVTFVINRLLLGYFIFNPSCIFKDLSLYFNYALNPIHKFGEIFEESTNIFFNGLAMFIDTITKIFSGYMIFQFLRAFRKYAK